MTDYAGPRPSARTEVTHELGGNDMKAADRYAQAVRALCENNIKDYAAGICHETPESTRLNSAVIDAERGVPWWRRCLARHRVVRELDYWNRTGGVG